MKILHVNISDSAGGASKAAYRLHNALVDAGADSHFFSLDKTQPTDRRSKKSKISKYLRLASPYLAFLPNKFYRKRRDQIFSSYRFGAQGIVDEINAYGADIVSLHFVSNGMLSLRQISRIKGTIVWYLHDFSPLTGGCHNVFNCDKYLNGCGSCPALESTSNRDLSFLNWKTKSKIYARMHNLHFIAVSDWVRQRAIHSKLLNNKSLVTVENCINYKNDLSRKPKNKSINRTIVFGAYNCFRDHKKGFDILYDALTRYEGGDARLVVFGDEDRGEFNLDALPIKVEVYGIINDDMKIREIYRNADVLVVSSREETFGLTAAEALSEGTPVVCFSDIGTMTMISHKSDGYIVNTRDPSALLEGIYWVLNCPDYIKISKNALEKAKKYSKINIAEKTLRSYERFLNA